MWFTQDGLTKIGKATSAGAVTEYSPGLTGAAFGIAKGPDGNVWFTEKGAKKDGYIKPSEPETSLKEFPEVGTLAGEPSFITAGPDGNLWVTMGTAGIARITPAGVVTEFPIASTNVCSITAGPDGNVWFGNCTSPRKVGKIDPTGAVTQYEVASSIGNQPTSIALGSDSRLWFPANGPESKRIGAITTAGVVSYYTTGEVNPSSVTAGPDGNIWFRETASSHERQAIIIKATEELGGTYKLSFNGAETGSIAYNAPAETVKAQLEALPTIGTGNVKVTKVESPNSVGIDVEFIGKLARTDVPLIGCNGEGLTGVEPSCTVSTTTKALPNRLFRVIPATGKVKAFSLKPATVLKSVVGASAFRTNALASGPGGIWYTAQGDATFPSSPAVGKFGLEAFKLNLTKEGTGGGTVVSDPAGIECGLICEEEFAAGKTVTLTASPDSESLFTSWKGCDVGGVNGRQCKVTGGANALKKVYAKFTRAYDISVSRKGSGLGKVSSTPGGILCLSNCSSTSAAFKEATNVTLTAVPSKNFTFTGWSGDCTGESTTCVLSALSADKSVEAEFTEVAKHLLTVTKSGGGQGTVKTNLAGINCGATCTSMAAAYYQGQEVELTQLAGKGSTFGGWSGACTGTGTCKVPITEAQEVTAEFK
jgi:hypothetical protein